MEKEFALSRTMRLSDYDQLPTSMLSHVEGIVGLHPHQHTHRRWEYGLLLKAYNQWLEGYSAPHEFEYLQVGDFGCGVGMSPSIMLALGHDVTMYEPWTHGNEDAYQMSSLEKVKASSAGSRTYKMLYRPLCELIDIDHNQYDISLCISTLEHIGEHVRAFEDLCKTVKRGGMMFLTFDYAHDHEDEKDDYALAYLRAGRMFNSKTMDVLISTARKFELEVLGTTDYIWDESCRLVNNYGFASLAMVKAQ